MRIERPRSEHHASWIEAVRLPPAGDAVPTRLCLTQKGGCVLWERTFDTMRADSRQWERNGRIMETMGPFLLEMNLVAEEGKVRFVPTGLRFLGIPVPRICGPRVRGMVEAGPTERSWAVRVEIGHALIGTICRYEGVMHAR